jgi:hypothetical protein
MLMHLCSMPLLYCSHKEGSAKASCNKTTYKA